MTEPTYEAERAALRKLVEAQNELEVQQAAEIEEARRPRPGDFPGLENDPNCLEPVRASWDRWLKPKEQHA